MGAVLKLCLGVGVATSLATSTATLGGTFNAAITQLDLLGSTNGSGTFIQADTTPTSAGGSGSSQAGVAIANISLSATVEPFETDGTQVRLFGIASATAGFNSSIFIRYDGALFFQIFEPSFFDIKVLGDVPQERVLFMPVSGEGGGAIDETTYGAPALLPGLYNVSFFFSASATSPPDNPAPLGGGSVFDQETLDWRLNLTIVPTPGAAPAMLIGALAPLCRRRR